MSKDKDIFGTNDVEDVAWLCSLSESETDLLMSLKMLAHQRARFIGHEELADKFDLKTLRAMSVTLLKGFKEKAKDISVDSGLPDPSFLDDSNLLKSNAEDGMSIDELQTLIGTNSKKSSTKRDRTRKSTRTET